MTLRRELERYLADLDDIDVLETSSAGVQMTPDCAKSIADVILGIVSDYFNN